MTSTEGTEKPKVSPMEKIRAFFRERKESHFKDFKELKQIKFDGNKYKLKDYIYVEYADGQSATGRLDSITQMSKGDIRLNLSIPLGVIKRGGWMIRLNEVNKIESARDHHDR